MMHIIDGGETALAEAARLDPNYSSQGIWDWFCSAPFFDLIKTMPLLKCYRITSHTKEIHLSRIKRARVSYKFKLSKVAFICKKFNLQLQNPN